MKWFGINKGKKYNGVFPYKEYLCYELYDVYTGTIFFKWDIVDGSKSLDEYESIKDELKHICLSTTDYDTPISYNRIASLFRDKRLNELGI